MTPAELEQRIDASVETAISNGWTIASCVYFVPPAKECCALSACVLRELIENAAKRPPHRLLNSGDVIKRVLGLSVRELTSFTDAFDRCPLQGHHDPNFYELGARMRAKHSCGKVDI